MSASLGVFGSRTFSFTCVAVLVLGFDDGHELGAGLERSGQIGPFAFTVGFRLSLAISSWRYAFGSAQSHIVTTTLRSRPCGRCGAAVGNSPLAIRSVQSAYIERARCPAHLRKPIAHPVAGLSGPYATVPGRQRNPQTRPRPFRDSLDLPVLPI